MQHRLVLRPTLWYWMYFRPVLGSPRLLTRRLEQLVEVDLVEQRREAVRLYIQRMSQPMYPLVQHHIVEG